MTLFCKRFRHVFILEIKNIPISYEKSDNNYSPYHSYFLYQAERPTNIKRNQSEYMNQLSVVDEKPRKYNQKQRLDSMFRHEVFSMVMMSDGNLWHDKHAFQIEGFKHAECFSLWCVGLDDYYLQQSSVSISVHERCSKFSEFVSRNVQTQFEYLKGVMKNEAELQQILQQFQTREEKFAQQFHLASTMLNKTLRIHPNEDNNNLRKQVILLFYQLFRKHSEFLLKYESIYFDILYHVQGIKQSLNLS